MRFQTYDPHLALTKAASTVICASATKPNTHRCSQGPLPDFILVYPLRQKNLWDRGGSIDWYTPTTVPTVDIIHALEEEATWDKTLIFIPVWRILLTRVRLVGVGHGQFHHFDERRE